MIPLPPNKIHAIWKAISELEFDTSFGNFNGMDVHDKELKRRTLESMQMHVIAQDYDDHPLLNEKLP